MRRTIHLLLIAVAVMMCGTVYAANADFPARPDTAIFVNDFAKLLTPDQSNSMDEMLRAFSRRSSNQIMVVTVKSIGDYDPKLYAAELGDRWGVGQKQLDNGLVILVKPKESGSKGQFALCPGRGLGGALPDAVCKRIVDEKAMPHLQRADYNAALREVLRAVMPMCESEISQTGTTKSADSNWMWYVAAFALVIAGVAYYNRKSKIRQAGETPEQREIRLADEARQKKEMETARKKLESKQAAQNASAATVGILDPNRRKCSADDRHKHDNAEKFGGGTFDGGGASSDW